MPLFVENTPDEIQIAVYNLNTTRDDINAYSYILTRIIVIFLIAVFVVTYFLFFHGSVVRYYKKKKAMRQPKIKNNNSIFKD